MNTYDHNADYSEYAWGSKTTAICTKNYSVNLFSVKKGKRIPFHYQRKREKTLMVFCGKGNFLIEDGDDIQSNTVQCGSLYHIPPGTVLSVEAIEDICFIETSTPTTHNDTVFI